MEEVGLAVLRADEIPDDELRSAFLAGELPVLGASPDAMLRPKPGDPLEIVEVKNVCERGANPNLHRHAPSTAHRFGRWHHVHHRSPPRPRTPAHPALITSPDPAAYPTTGPFFATRSSDQLHVWARHLSEDERASIPWYEARGPHEHLPAQYVPQVRLDTRESSKAHVDRQLLGFS